MLAATSFEPGGLLGKRPSGPRMVRLPADTGDVRWPKARHAATNCATRLLQIMIDESARWSCCDWFWIVSPMLHASRCHHHRVAYGFYGLELHLQRRIDWRTWPARKVFSSGSSMSNRSSRGTLEDALDIVVQLIGGQGARQAKRCHHASGFQQNPACFKWGRWQLV